MWTRETALPVIQEAFDNEKLSVQNGAVRCRYRSAAGPCVIGLLIDDKTANILESSDWSTPLAGTTSSEIWKLFAEEDHGWFMELQAAHDRWINERREGGEFTTQERKFRELIGR